MKRKISLAILFAMGILGGFIAADLLESLRTKDCFMKPDGSVYCYERGTVKRLRADHFKVIKEGGAH